MKIQIDTHADSPAEMGIAIAALIACGAEPVQGCEKATRSPDIGGMAGVKDFTTEELRARIEALNAELYSRRIPAVDDPSAGVEKAASNSDVRGNPAHSSGLLHVGSQSDGEAAKIAINGVIEKINLAEVFGMAAKGPSDADIAGENQKSTDEQSSAFAKASAESIAANGVQLDKAGLPWDSRIHAGSKAINQTDGLWRQRRGVDPAVVATVEAELRQAMSAPRGGEVMREEQSDGKVTDVDPSDKGIDVVKIPPPPPTVVTPPAPPLAADTGEIDSLPRLLKFITEQKLAGKLNQTQVNQALIAVGIEGPLPVLQARPDLIPTVAGKLRALAGM